VTLIAKKPVSDAEFRIYRSLDSYDRTPLNASAERIEQTEVWTREKITFTAGYGNERMFAYLYLPNSPARLYRRWCCFLEMELFGFIVKAGRALMVPAYKGTYERGDDLKSDYPNTTISWRDHVISWSKDLGRSIDHLETRPGIDSRKQAYVGGSWGGAMGSVLPAVEPRIKACVRVVPGFNLQRSRPDVDELNLAPRVTVPVLMLNGRFDFFYPAQTSQEPMFRFLGTSKEQKRRVVYDTGHGLAGQVSWPGHVRP
jgi:hypothetical protein